MAISESDAVVNQTDLPDIAGDATQLSQLFLNLISNALKFRKKDVSPLIDITCTTVLGRDIPRTTPPPKTASYYYQIEVSDNSIGFEQQYADRIFQLFQRLHGRSEYEGTGIDLQFAKGLQLIMVAS